MLTPDLVSTLLGRTEPHNDKLIIGVKKVSYRVFRVYPCSHPGEARRILSEVLRYHRVCIYTTIAQTRNINIQATSLLLKPTSTEQRSYQYNRFSTLSLPIPWLSESRVFPLSTRYYTCLPSEFSDTDALGHTCQNHSSWSYHPTVPWCWGCSLDV